jgi:hypothetical protein
VRKYGRDKNGPDSIGENQPLTELDGIDLYERARLAGEGVGNIEALAHGNLVDLLLQTRIPAGRLIDWVDQAILYLHTTLRTAEDRQQDRVLFDALRRLGIRTATDLILATQRPDGADVIVDAIEPFTITSQQIELLVASMNDTEWIGQLLSWRSNRTRRPVVVHASTVDNASRRMPGQPSSRNVVVDATERLSSAPAVS